MTSQKATKYKDEGISEIMDKYGAFFAFGKKQMEEEADEDTNYTHLFSGLHCPKENAEKLIEEMNEVVEEAIAIDKEENTDREIVKHQLANHEVQISQTLEPTMEALEGYDISEEFVREVYNEEYKNAPAL